MFWPGSVRAKLIITGGSIIAICSVSCKEDSADSPTSTEGTEVIFDSVKWRVKKDNDYPYREQMVNALLYDNDLRTLNESAILDLLGAPDRRNEGYLYYTVNQTRLGFWPLHTKSLVVKFSADNNVEWIKLHE